jgi:hypothetical protein
MRKLIFSISLFVLVVSPLSGQSAQKIADINKKVIGKWWSSDRKSYIKFLADGSCSNGELWPDGKWHLEQNTLDAWQQGEDFRCGSGALTLIGPNTLTRDYGMGGKPEIFHRVVVGAVSTTNR